MASVVADWQREAAEVTRLVARSARVDQEALDLLASQVENTVDDGIGVVGTSTTHTQLTRGPWHNLGVLVTHHARLRRQRRTFAVAPRDPAAVLTNVIRPSERDPNTTSQPKPRPSQMDRPRRRNAVMLAMAEQMETVLSAPREHQRVLRVTAKTQRGVINEDPRCSAGRRK